MPCDGVSGLGDARPLPTMRAAPVLKSAEKLKAPVLPFNKAIYMWGFLLLGAWLLWPKKRGKRTFTPLREPLAFRPTITPRRRTPQEHRATG